MRIAYSKVVTVIQLDDPVVVKRYNRGPIEATQVKFVEYDDGDTEVTFGGYILTQSGERHAGATFGWHLAEKFEDALALQWLRELRR